MKLSMKKVPKKWYSGLAIVAFLALSVMTAYNIKIGSDVSETKSTAGQEELGESKDTIGSAVVPEDSGEESADTESQDYKSSKEKLLENGMEQEEQEEETKSEESQETKEENGNREDTEEREGTQDQKKSTFHYDGEKTLEWPVVGNIVLPYSMDTTIYYTTLDQYACNDGIMISAKKGEEVKASADGRVVNLYESDRYGMIMTVLIGDYYEISYGQIDNAKYQIGDEVKQGDVLGTVAEPSRSFVLEGPNLFVKLTYKGEAVNPADYLKS